jgi:hypothetical protein
MTTVMIEVTSVEVVESATAWRGSHTHLTSDGCGETGPVYWTVIVEPSANGLVKRRIYQERQRPPSDRVRPAPGPGEADPGRWFGADTSWEPEEIIWPAWFPGLGGDDGRRATPLSGAREQWTGLGDRLRDSAKWMSTVLGAALGLLLGTLPLADMWKAGMGRDAMIWGAAGLFLLCFTLILLLRVIRPSVVSFADVQMSDRKGLKGRIDPLSRWKHTVETQQDLYLPCGINNLDGLRHAIIVEEATLAAIACAVQDATSQGIEHPELPQARDMRAARLRELKCAVEEIATIGEFYKVRQHSWCASYLGVFASGIGVLCIVAALLIAHP